MEKAFAFARVSTDEQAQGGISLGLQAEAMERYCREKSLELVRVWQVAETATSEGQREKFQAMLAKFEKKLTLFSSCVIVNLNSFAVLGVKNKAQRSCFHEKGYKYLVVCALSSSAK